MERDRSFNFRLLVPPRVNNGQVSAVRPQEIVDNSGDFMKQGYTKCFGKAQNMPFPNTSVVTPTKPTRQDLPQMTIVPPVDESNCDPGQLYSKLFDEVEKIKWWKVKVDSDTVQKERRLQENKITIETQRKAIQELQFGNESLSIKLEEQIAENEDLRNKDNITRNLCNILKDTFERSAEKMHLFESEREETHQLFMENTQNIQKMIAAFESLRIQAEADQQEMQKVKESLLQFEELKQKYHQEYIMKEEEVAGLQVKLNTAENELQKSLLDLQETERHCKQLQEATNQQHELLKSSKVEQESLVQKLHTAEHHHEETQKKCEAVAAALEQSKEEYTQIIQSKDLSLQELSRIKSQQAEKLEQIQTTIQGLQNSLALEIQRAKELEEKLMAKSQELERRNTLLRETLEQSAKKDGHIKVLEDERGTTSEFIASLKAKIDGTDVRVDELTAELSRKSEEVQLSKSEVEMAHAENVILKSACEVAEKAREDLEEKCTVTEIKVLELQEQLFTEVKKNEDQIFQMEQMSKDIAAHKVKYEELLSDFSELQSEKIAIQQQFESGSSYVKTIEENMKVSEEKAVKLTREIQRLEDQNQCLREEVNSIKTQIQGKCEETLQRKFEEKCEHLEEEITEKEEQIKTMETKLCNLREKNETKLSAQAEYQKKNKILKKQIARETAKSSHLENVISGLHEEFQSLKKLNLEDHQKLLKDLEHKSALAVKLENEVQKLRSTATDAIKNKENTELRCQQKIADMVALMEKHKSQYDRIVKEKDVELNENKKKAMDAVTCMKSLELDLADHRTENDQLKKQLMAEKTMQENLQKELTDQKKEISSMKFTQLSDAKKKESSASNYKQGSRSGTPKERASKRHTLDLPKTRIAHCYSDDGNIDITDIHNEDLKTPSIINRVVGPSKIKSYRIRTPPSAEKAADWGKCTTELKAKSGSSDQIDLLALVSAPARFSDPHCPRNTFKKIQSPVIHQSPGNTLKLAAMKRMRDAGWTAVTGCDKKKKDNEKIFA